MALTGLDCSSASALPRGSMALPDPRVRPLRHTAPPRKWTPAARLCRPGPPPARGSGLGGSEKRSARPSARGPRRPGNCRAEDEAAGGQRRDPDRGRETHDGRARPRQYLVRRRRGGWGLEATTAPRGPHTPPKGQWPPSLGTTQLGACPKDNWFGGQRPPSLSEQGLGRQKGPWIPDPDLRGHPSPAHFREAGFGESQVLF